MWLRDLSDGWREPDCGMCVTDDGELAEVDSRVVSLQSGRETTANQAVFYDNRGSAYDNKGLYDQAIADGTQSLALDPSRADLPPASGHSLRARTERAAGRQVSFV